MHSLKLRETFFLSMKIIVGNRTRLRSTIFPINLRSLTSFFDYFFFSTFCFNFQTPQQLNTFIRFLLILFCSLRVRYLRNLLPRKYGILFVAGASYLYRILKIDCK